MNEKLKVVIAGGGTGGHLFPAIAVAEVLKERGHEVVIFISEKEIDRLVTRDLSDRQSGSYRFETIPGVGMPKLLSPAVFSFISNFRSSISHCGRLYKEIKPDAVLGMGGFTSTAPIYAGWRRKIPTFLHESNAIPGKANRLNARMVKSVLLGFQECARHFPKSKCETTGTPIRKSLLKRIPKEEARRELGLEPGRKTLLIMGGSQGARSINKAAIQALSLFKDLSLQAIHLTGPEEDQLVLTNYRREGLPAYVAPFCNQMELAYSAADLAIARSGAASLSELSFFGLPSILVPYPFAAEDHQTLNAEIFSQRGAAALLNQSQITSEKLAALVGKLINDPVELERMARNARQLAPENAAARVCEVIEAQAGRDPKRTGSQLK